MIFSLTAHDWLFLVIGGVLNALAFTCYIGAIQLGKPSVAVAIDRAGILYVVIFSVLFLNEAFSIKAVLGAGLMVLGAALLSV